MSTEVTRNYVNTPFIRHSLTLGRTCSESRGLGSVAYTTWTAEKSVSNHSDQMDTSLLTDYPNDHNDPCDRWNRIRFYSSDCLSDRNDRERSKRSYGHSLAIVDDQNDRHISKVHCSSGSFHADFDFGPKNTILELFLTIGTIEWT